jgi:hypothetical protein
LDVWKEKVEEELFGGIVEGNNWPYSAQNEWTMRRRRMGHNYCCLIWMPLPMPFIGFICILNEEGRCPVN